MLSKWEIDIVEKWAEELRHDDTIEVSAETHIAVEKIARFNDNILIIGVMSGKSGETGIAHDLEGVADDIPIREMQAPMSHSRAVLFSPSNGQMAMRFSEYSARSSGARNLLTLLKKAWPHLNTGAKFNESRAIMSEALTEGGKITEVEVRLTRRSSDLADGVYYHEELNGPGQPILTDNELIEFCSEEAVTCFGCSGYCRDPSWSQTNA